MGEGGGWWEREEEVRVWRSEDEESQGVCAQEGQGEEVREGGAEEVGEDHGLCGGCFNGGVEELVFA